MEENKGFLEEKLFVIYRYIKDKSDPLLRQKVYLGNHRYAWYNQVNEAGVEFYDNYEEADNKAVSWKSAFAEFYVEEI